MTCPRLVSWNCRTSSSPALADERQCTWRRSSPGTYSRRAWKARSLIESCWLVAPSRSLVRPPAKTGRSVTRGATSSSTAAPALEPAGDRTDRIGLLVGHRSHLVDAAGQVGKAEVRAWCRAKGARNGSRSWTVTGPTGTRSSETASAPPRPARRGPAWGRGCPARSAAAAASAAPSGAPGRSCHTRPRTSSPTATLRELGELLPVEPRPPVDRHDAAVATSPRPSGVSSRSGARARVAARRAPGTLVVHARSRGAGTASSRPSMTSSAVVPPNAAPDAISRRCPRTGCARVATSSGTT